MIDPGEKADDSYEVIAVYDSPDSDTIIYYDSDDNQYVEVKDS
jgi:hypothetical protein